jgi:hypothetical protein
MDILAELLTLYTDHSVAEIESDGELLLNHFNVATRDELVAINGYSEAFALVSSCASLVESLAARCPRPDDQVRESLRFLRRMVDDSEPAKKIDTIRALIEGRLRASWSAVEQATYDKKKEILDWRDFFVSYTNRDAPSINGTFRTLIKDALGAAPKGNDNNSNYLARIVTRHLRRYQSLSGFFDEENLKVGEDIQEGVDRYCTKAFALVQLVESLTFEREPPRNWCFYEYARFSQNPAVVGLLGDKHRHFFILTAALREVTPANLSPLFQGWYSRIQALLKTHILLNGERNTTLRTKMNAIAIEIVALRAEIVNAWLKQ